MLAKQATASFGRAFELSQAANDDQDATTIALVIPVKPVESAACQPVWNYLYWTVSIEEVHRLTELYVTSSAWGVDGYTGEFDTLTPALEAVKTTVRIDANRDVFFVAEVDGVNGEQTEVVSNCHLTHGALIEMVNSARSRDRKFVGVAPAGRNQVYFFSEEVMMKTDNLHRIIHRSLRDFDAKLEQQMDMLCTYMVESL